MFLRLKKLKNNLINSVLLFRVCKTRAKELNLQPISDKVKKSPLACRDAACRVEFATDEHGGTRNSPLTCRDAACRVEKVKK